MPWSGKAPVRPEYVHSTGAGSGDVSGILLLEGLRAGYCRDHHHEFGSDCPYEGAYERLSKRIDRVYALMKERGIPTSRLKLTTICTVCRSAFLKEISEMRKNVTETTTPSLIEALLGPTSITTC